MPENQSSILVVDDSPDNLRALSTMLKAGGYRVRKATSGAMALETVRAQVPDLILLDVRMPEVNGFDVCAALKRSPQTREIPILFISASAEVDDKVKAFEVGGADYITKPFRVREVLARVNYQLTIQQQQQQLAELCQQVQVLNNRLEQQVDERTKELQQALEKLQRLNQLKDDFLSTVSHELRTPIANIHMVLQLLTAATRHGQDFFTVLSNESSNGTSKVSQYLDILQQECDREIYLIQNLLDLQQLNAGTYPLELTPINLYDSIPHLLESFAISTQKKQQILQVQLAPDLLVIKSDRTSLQRILMELLNNACKYTPVGGTITLSVTLQSAADTLSNSVIQIAVTNTGSEIPEQEQSYIFDQFYRVPSDDPWKHGGTGLGLALVQKLVQQLGGYIWVRSGDNITCFTMQLPYS